MTWEKSLFMIYLRAECSREIDMNLMSQPFSNSASAASMVYLDLGEQAANAIAGLCDGS